MMKNVNNPQSICSSICDPVHINQLLLISYVPLALALGKVRKQLIYTHKIHTCTVLGFNSNIAFKILECYVLYTHLLNTQKLTILLLLIQLVNLHDGYGENIIQILM